MEKLPNVLVVNVKRFYYDMKHQRSRKMQEHVNFEEDLLVRRKWLSKDL